MIRLTADDGDSVDGWDDEVDGQMWRDALRSTLAAPYADASEDDLDRALNGALSSMSAAEGFSLAGALNNIARSAGQVASTPAFGQVAGTALPIAGTALGTALGGPVGAAVGGHAATMAAAALRPRTVGAPAPAAPAAPAVPAAPAAHTVSAAPAAPTVSASRSGVPGAGSAAATQALVLAQQPELLQGLLAASLGQYGQRQVAGIPVARMLGLLSELANQAAADADELAYLAADDGEDLLSGDSESNDDLYARLVGAEKARLDSLLDEGPEPW